MKDIYSRIKQPKVGIWKKLLWQKVVKENNQLKYGGYSLLFSMLADDDEQHFN